jgi:hypothetical protein
MSSLAAVAFGLAALFLFMRARHPSVGRSSSAPAKTFAGTNKIAIVLGGEETGNGLNLITWEKDGSSIATTAAGSPCRQLSGGGRNTAFLYFIMDPTFKETSVSNVRIDIEYLDAPSGAFGIHYDASETSTSANPAYTRHNRTVTLRGSNTWNNATFYVHDGTFHNGQNSGADFRISATPPDLFFRTVAVSRNLRVDDGTQRILRANLSEAQIPGNYRLFEGEEEIGTIVLHKGGSITNWRNETKPGYHWQLQQEGLLLDWLKGFHLFSDVLKPGVFAGLQNGESIRLERHEGF